MAEKFDDETNPFATPQSDLAPENFQRTPGTFVYGDFGQRFVAAFVDGIIVNILSYGVGFGLGLVAVATGMNDESTLAIVGGLVGLVVGWLYSALQESSDARATLGKKMMGLAVVDLAGDKISFGRATGRHFAKIPSAMICLIGYLMQPFTEKKQALHDIMAGTLVIKP